MKTMSAKYPGSCRNCTDHVKAGDQIIFESWQDKGRKVSHPICFEDEIRRDYLLPNQEHCRQCAGSGMYITMIENGKPKGPGGTCYQCQGKGKQTYADALRNRNYDVYQRGKNMIV